MSPVQWLQYSDAIWWHISESTLAQIVACCLTETSHFLNQCWLGVNMTITNTLQLNLNRNCNITIEENVVENIVFKIVAILSRSQCVRSLWGCWHWHWHTLHIEGILPKGPYLPCVSMAGRALLAGYPRYPTPALSYVKTNNVYITLWCTP